MDWLPPRLLGFLIASAFLSACGWGAWLFIRMNFRRGSPRWTCPNCGYNKRRSGITCPECGLYAPEDYTPSEAEVSVSKVLWWSIVGGPMLVTIIVGIAYLMKSLFF